ncbi:MAG: DUF3592 domain-containing protein [Terracidiphilus sp.]
MLIEMWERLRGYDKWIQTEARIKSSTIEKTYRKGRRGRLIPWWTVTNVIAWADSSGGSRIAQCIDPSGFPPHQLSSGETVTIRYNPTNPSDFYLRGLLKSRIISMIKWAVAIALGFAVALLLLWH